MGGGRFWNLFLVIRESKEINLPILLVFLSLLESSQSLRSPAMRYVPLEMIQAETKFLCNMGNFIPLNSLTVINKDQFAKILMGATFLCGFFYAL